MRKFFILIWLLVDQVVGNADNGSNMVITLCFSIALFFFFLGFIYYYTKYYIVTYLPFQSKIAIPKKSTRVHAHLQPNALNINLELLMAFVSVKSKDMFSIRNTQAMMTTAKIEITTIQLKVVHHMKRNSNPLLNHST